MHACFLVRMIRRHGMYLRIFVNFSYWKMLLDTQCFILSVRCSICSMEHLSLFEFKVLYVASMQIITLIAWISNFLRTPPSTHTRTNTPRREKWWLYCMKWKKIILAFPPAEWMSTFSKSSHHLEWSHSQPLQTCDDVLLSLTIEPALNKRDNI